VDFGQALRTVSGFLEERGWRHAVIGGVALVAYGSPRTTFDTDFVVEAEAQEELVRFLESLGYQTLYRSSGYSNHLHPDPERGRLDFVYVQGETAEKLFAACRRGTGPGGEEILVPSPEHLAALKVLAMTNDPERSFQEIADIRFLLSLPGVDRTQVRAYFERHGLAERFRQLEEPS
jgi:hypothetical protein